MDHVVTFSAFLKGSPITEEVFLSLVLGIGLSGISLQFRGKYEMFTMLPKRNVYPGFTPDRLTPCLGALSQTWGCSLGHSGQKDPFTGQAPNENVPDLQPS